MSCMKVLRNKAICGKTANFVVNDKTYCSIHKKICVTCFEKQSSFGDQCKSCSVNSGKFIKSSNVKYCVYKSDGGIVCEKRAIFGYITNNKKQYLYCKSHKTDDSMNINKISSLCNEEGCKVIANYMLKTDKKPTKCLQHKEENMIVSYKQCEQDNCTTKPTYGTIKDGKLTCSTHKKIGYIKINKCKAKQCNKIATYGENLGTNEKPSVNKNKYIYCDKHTIDGYISDNVDIDGLIDGVKNITIKDKKSTRVEIFVKGYLEGKGYKFIHNSRLVGTYNININRPDFLLKMDNCNLMVEVDEHQHTKCKKLYEGTKEIDRIREFYNDLGDFKNNIYKPLYVVRFNPDKYKDKDNIEQNSSVSDRMPYICNVIDNIIKNNEENNVTEGIHISYHYYDHNKPDYKHYKN